MRILSGFLAVCLFAFAALAQTIPSDRHPVVIVMLENHSYSSMYLSSNMPNLTSMTKQYGVATNFNANGHYSIGNYMYQTFGKVETTDDNYNPDTQGYFSDDNIIRHLLTLGKTYKMYAENIDAAGSTELVSKDGLYVRRHNPLSYTSEFGNMTSAQRALVEVGFAKFATDLAAHQLPDYAFVAPNLVNDAHNGSDPQALQTADAWLQKNIFGPLLADATFQQTGLLIISVDESVNSDCLPATKCPSLPEYTSYCTSNCTKGGGHVLMVLIGPHVKTAYQSSTSYMHETTLKTVLQGFGGTTYPNGLSAVPSMNTFFQSLTNPGFELSATNWKCYGSCSIGTKSGVARTGTHYGDLISSGPGSQPILRAADASGSEYYAVKAGQVVTFSAWGSRFSGDGQAHAVLEVTDSSKKNPTYVVSTPNNISSSTWTLTTGTYTVPSGKAFVRFYTEIKSSTKSSEV